MPAPRCLTRGGLVLSLLAGCAGAQKPAPAALPAGELDRFRGSSAAAELGAEGWIVVDELRADVGDGKGDEAVVVEGRLQQGPEPEELRVSIWRPTPEGWKRLGRSEAVPGSSVGLLAPARCDGERVLLFATAEDEPDQRRYRLLVLGGLPGLRKAYGVQRDVAAGTPAAFESADGGFAFRAGDAVERWRCAGEGFAQEPLPPAISPGAPPVP